MDARLGGRAFNDDSEEGVQFLAEEFLPSGRLRRDYRILAILKGDDCTVGFEDKLVNVESWPKDFSTQLQDASGRILAPSGQDSRNRHPHSGHGFQGSRSA